jgi:hypothetical protein
VCGDDETLAYKSWAAAVLHAIVADEAGYTSQVTKGLLSRQHDEFLQLMRSPGNVPVYPVANTILTFCSRNWYKDPVRDLSSTIKDVSDHLWDMHLGGVPLEFCRQLGIQVLDYLMQVKDKDGNLVPLEWWGFRGMGVVSGHPLWGSVGTELNPELDGVLELHNVPGHASLDSIARESEWRDIISDVEWARIKRGRIAQSYRTVARHALTEQYDAYALLHWPTRKSAEYVSPAGSRLPAVASNRWRVIPARQVARSARAVAVQVRFPPELLDTTTMWAALKVMRPRDRATMLQGLHDRQKPTQGWRWWLPPLMRVV